MRQKIGNIKKDKTSKKKLFNDVLRKFKKLTEILV